MVEPVQRANKNRLREQKIHGIVDTFRRQADVPRYARRVGLDEIADPNNDYNLKPPRCHRYVGVLAPQAMLE